MKKTMESYKHLKVPFDSPKHEEKVLLTRKIDEELGHKKQITCFGAAELQEIELFQTNHDEFPQSEFLQGVFSKDKLPSVIDRLRKKWDRLIDSRIDVFPLIYPILKQKKFRDLLCKQKIFSPRVTAFLRSLRQKEISLLDENKEENFSKRTQFLWFRASGIKELSDEIIIECTKAYYEETSREMERVRLEILPEILPRVKENIRRAMKEQNLPFTEEYLEFVFAKIQVEPIDPLSAYLEEIGGEYFSETETIFVDTKRPLERLEKTLTHEFFHALSGKTILHQKGQISGDEYNSSTNRVGTHFYANGKSTFSWMNEAITETLTMKTTNTQSENASYLEERKLLELFLQKIDFSFFTNAYFEQFDPEAPQQERIPHWRKLAEKIKEMYGEYFLNDLEKYIRLVRRQDKKFNKYGSAIKKVVEDFTLHGDNFPNFLRQQIHPQDTLV